mgnify:CR=1 FL=1
MVFFKMANREVIFQNFKYKSHHKKILIELFLPSSPLEGKGHFMYTKTHNSYIYTRVPSTQEPMNLRPFKMPKVKTFKANFF